MFSPEHVICLGLFCFVLFSGLNYHVAADPFSGVRESESWVFGAGKNERSKMLSKKEDTK